MLYLAFFFVTYGHCRPLVVVIDRSYVFLVASSKPMLAIEVHYLDCENETIKFWYQATIVWFLASKQLSAFKLQVTAFKMELILV